MVRDTIDHLFKTYSRFTSSQFDDTRAKVREAWDPSVPIHSLFSKIKRFTDLLEAAQEPLSDKQLVRYDYDSIL